ncbi:hypothetical protein D3C85_1029860 [compost metagenome]
MVKSKRLACIDFFGQLSILIIYILVKQFQSRKNQWRSVVVQLNFARIKRGEAVYPPHKYLAPAINKIRPCIKLITRQSVAFGIIPEPARCRIKFR